MEKRLYVSSIPTDTPKLGIVVRNHWSIESMHWGMDYNLQQDNIKRKSTKAARNLDTVQILGCSLASGDWCIVTSPKRRHKVRNFASLISARLAELLGIPFYEDIAECHSKHRVGAVFTFGAEPPKVSNIIVFDDFVTTGATMISMRELLMPLGYNLVFFTAINNKL